MILSHAAAANLYREKYQASQEGIVGITVQTFWMVPKYPTTSCRKAALTALDFFFGWIIHPMTYGDYPETMRDLVGDRLPKFTVADMKMVKGSLDFVGVNYYTARFAEEATASGCDIDLSYTTDSHANLTTERNGIPIGEQVLYPIALLWYATKTSIISGYNLIIIKLFAPG
uniref:Beta-glucosidase 17-like n=1 Tax=Rhizophora mucronata TaxID=61149 RepID=A0A2P2LKK3_RHIMU